MSLLGEPDTTEVGIFQDSRPTPEVLCAPKYLVYPIDSKRVGHLIDPPRIKLIDFGQSFHVDQSPEPPAFGIPLDYAAPEVFFDDSGSMAMDLWSLACTIYEIRVGRPLFEIFQIASRSKPTFPYMDEISLILGRPPEPWAEYFREDPGTTITGIDNTTEPSAARVCKLNHEIKDIPTFVRVPSETAVHQPISDAEAKALADLLEKLLRYQPCDRLSARDAIEHVWFSGDYDN